MPSYNITVDDGSPLWIYSGKWTPEDPEPDWFSNKTLHWTNATDASVSTSFNGTGIYLYGGGADFNGSYTVTVDGQTYAPNPPTSRDQIPLLLYSQDALPRGLHTVTLTDTSDDPSRRLYFDRGVITFGDGDKSSIKKDSLVDDNASNITYSDGWETSQISWSQYFWGKTMHRWSTGTNIQANINFWGNSITLFGATSNNHKTYTISLDGGPPQTFNGYSLRYNAQAMLYLASDLEPVDHTLVVTAVEATAFSIDYYVASTWTSSDSPSSSNSSSVPAETSSDPEKGSSTPVGAIAGGVAGGLILLAGLLIAFFLLRRRRKRASPVARQEKSGIDSFPLEQYGPPGGVAEGMAAASGQQKHYVALADGASSDGNRVPPRSPGTAQSEFSDDTEQGGRRWAGQEVDAALMLPPGYDQVLAARAVGAPPPGQQEVSRMPPPARTGSVTGSDVYSPRRPASATTATTDDVYAPYAPSPGQSRGQTSATTGDGLYERVQQAYAGYPQEKPGPQAAERSGSQRGSRPLPAAPR